MEVPMKDKSSINIEDKLFDSYIAMRKHLLDYDNFKYETLDSHLGSSEFKAGFYAGVRVMFSLFLDSDECLF